MNSQQSDLYWNSLHKITKKDCLEIYLRSKYDFLIQKIKSFKFWCLLFQYSLSGSRVTIENLVQDGNSILTFRRTVRTSYMYV